MSNEVPVPESLTEPPAESLAAGERPSVTIHAGMGKTGTTSVQAVLRRSRRALRGHGVLYPKSPGPGRHLRLTLAMQPHPDQPGRGAGWRRVGYSTPGELRPVLESELFAEVRRWRPETVLLSDEALFVLPRDGLRNLRDLLDRLAGEVRVVVYLRRQDDHLCSRYQQAVKAEREVRRLSERVAETSFSHLYDYHARLVAWRDLVGPDHLVVRPFERERFVGGSLLQDFLEATGVDVPVDDLTAVPSRNESLDAETVEFLRLRNIFHLEREEYPDPAQTRAVLGRLGNARDGGPTLTLPPRQLDEFMGRWEESNQRVSDDFATAGPTGLFSTDRKSRGTTTEQVLDPGRVEHYVELAGLPEEMVPALRRIARREARP